MQKETRNLSSQRKKEHGETWGQKGRRAGQSCRKKKKGRKTQLKRTRKRKERGLPVLLKGVGKMKGEFTSKKDYWRGTGKNAIHSKMEKGR